MRITNLILIIFNGCPENKFVIKRFWGEPLRAMIKILK